MVRCARLGPRSRRKGTRARAPFCFPRRGRQASASWAAGVAFRGGTLLDACTFPHAGVGECAHDHQRHDHGQNDAGGPPVAVAAKDDARVEAAMEGMRPTVVMSTTRRAGMPDRAAA